MMSPEVFELYVEIEALEALFPLMNLYNMFDLLHAGEYDKVRLILSNIRQIIKINTEKEEQ